ncbi:ABC transporter permease subunit [Leptospira sp. 'Mane']|uniref:ABC transporter permease subunit n=1 Tax=Leptospira sp. 'Mane' TaxID=3387407 RepID=UPI00398BA3E0
MKSEILRFFLFLVLLSFIANFISIYRAKDKEFLYADGGISKINRETSNTVFAVSASYFQFWKNIIREGGGKTQSGENIYSHIGGRILPSFHLALFAILFGSVLGILSSSVSLFFKSRFLFKLLNFLSETILSTPVFVAAVVLLLLFFYKWELFPPGGYEPWNTYYVVLPGVALGMRVFARIYLFHSKEVWMEAESPYILLLKTRGYPWKHIVFKEIFIKVFPVTMILIVLDFGSLISGAMVVEEIFFFPGIGKSLFFSIKSMDTDLLSTLLLYTGVVFYILNRFAMKWQKKLSGETYGST